MRYKTEPVITVAVILPAGEVLEEFSINAQDRQWASFEAGRLEMKYLPKRTIIRMFEWRKKAGLKVEGWRTPRSRVSEWKGDHWQEVCPEAEYHQLKAITA